MALAISDVRAEIKEKSASRKENKSGKERAKQTVYFVRKGINVHYVGRDKERAGEVGKEHGLPVIEASSYKSLPPTVIRATFDHYGNLAETFLALGNSFGTTDDQNKEKCHTMARTLIEAQDAIAFQNKTLGLSAPPALPETLDEGEWVKQSVSKNPSAAMDDDEREALRAYAAAQANGEAK